VLRRCVWSRNIKNRCSIYIYNVRLLRVKAKETVRATFPDTPSNVNSLHRGTTVNCARYIAILRRLTAFLRQVRLARKLSEMQLLCDNARPHTTIHFTERPSHVLDGQYYLVHTIRLSRVLSYENTFTVTRHCTTPCASGCTARDTFWGREYRLFFFKFEEDCR